MSCSGLLKEWLKEDLGLEKHDFYTHELTKKDDIIRKMQRELDQLKREKQKQSQDVHKITRESQLEIVRLSKENVNLREEIRRLKIARSYKGN